MTPFFSIIYAHRNRDIERIRLSFNSLSKQEFKNFEVIFVDYGSDDVIISALKDLAAEFDFVKFHSLKVSHLLWNKSKALNYGIKRANGEYIFIADVDLIFHPETTRLFQQINASDKFQLFKLGYLDRTESRKLLTKYNFENLKPERLGEVNGMVLTTKESLLKINGMDEFFHFYGAEDEDLFRRLENAGYQRMKRNELYFYHQWHQSFSGSENKLLTENPRMNNIMRINQRHYGRNRDKGVIKPLKQKKMGTFVREEVSARLKSPTSQYRIPNIQAYVEHFLREEISTLAGKVIQVNFFEDSYSTSLKYRLKKNFYKQTQPYISMKEVNDLILKEILYNYRDHNYSYKVEKGLKNIEFRLEL